MFKLRIIEADYYFAKSVDEDEIFDKVFNKLVKMVPIIRIFGTTTLGKKCCLHLHNCFPHITIQWDEDVDNIVVTNLANEINQNLLKICVNKTIASFVYNIEIIQTKSIYGFHKNAQTFLKVYLCNPNDLKKLNELFLKGVIFNRKFQPYQSHLPYVLQMFIDQNLFGMNFVYLSQYTMRKNQDLNLLKNIKPQLEGIIMPETTIINLYNGLSKQSYCEVEIDSDIKHIKNKSVYQNLQYSAYPGIDDLINDDIILRKFYHFEEPPSFGSNNLPEFNKHNEMADLEFDLSHSGVEKMDKHLFNSSSGEDIMDDLDTPEFCQPLFPHNDEDKDGIYQLDGIFNAPRTRSSTSVQRNRHKANHKTYYPDVTKKNISAVKNDELFAQNLLSQESIITSSCLSCLTKSETTKQCSRKMAKTKNMPIIAKNRLITTTYPIVKARNRDKSLNKIVHANVRKKAITSERNDVKIQEIEMNYNPLDHSLIETNAPLSKDNRLHSRIETPSTQDVLIKTIKNPITKPNNRERLVFSYQIEDEKGFDKPKSAYPDITFPDINTESLLYLKEYIQLPANSDNFNQNTLEVWKQNIKTQNKSLLPVRNNKSLLIKPALNFMASRKLDCTSQNKKGHFQDNISNTLIKDSSFCNLQGLQMHNINASLIQNKSNNVINLQRVQHVTSMSCELHVQTQGDLLPNPLLDEIKAIFFTIYNDGGSTCLNVEPNKSDGNSNDAKKGKDGVTFEDDLVNGFCMVCTSEEQLKNGKYLAGSYGIPPYFALLVSSEHELFEVFWKNVMVAIDPDVLIGFEIEKSSWGFLCNRAHTLGIVQKGEDYLSRLVVKERIGFKHQWNDSKSCDINNKDALPQRVQPEMRNTFSEPYYYSQKIPGRVLFNAWRIVRKHLANNNYTFENVYYRLLNRRTAKYSFKTLNTWFPEQRWRVLKYYFIRTQGVHLMLEKLDTLDQTSEFARLYGIELHNVIDKGSQYKVESMMIRLAHHMGYIAVSPLPFQRNRMSMSQTMPLVMEPEAGLYTDPVIVLDFQSLYPSIIIGYNYCYSTCLGYLKNWAPLKCPFKFGCTELLIDLDCIEKMKLSIHVSPVGVGFVSKGVRLGVLPSMLYKILNARIRVKDTLKLLKKTDRLEPYLEKLLQARQLALKMIANVTYGYTSAYFSGRMPCVEIADSIVSKGREILQKTIDYIASKKGINARVIYGDTDSIFVLLKGHSRPEAFDIGEMLAKEISELYVQPVELKFEKVYQPCILQSKKRYVGFSYESKSQREPKYDAKGIETVRRDFCAAVPKVLERVITELFKTGDVSNVRVYLEEQFKKIIEGKVCLQDFIIAKEYRGRSGYKIRACVPALEIAKRSLKIDPMSEPLIKERVSYVIITPEHKGNLRTHQNAVPLINLVRTPYEYMRMGNARLNSEYYITKQLIPPINRIMKLIGFDILKWYQDMTRNISISLLDSLEIMEKGDSLKDDLSLTRYFNSKHCFICRTKATDFLCKKCSSLSTKSTYHLNMLIQRWSAKYQAITQICKSCTRVLDPTIKCISLDCPVFYHLVNASKKMAKVSVLDNMQDQILEL